MDKKRSLLNVGVSIGFKIVLLIALILERRFLIQYVGNEINGINSLYISIVGFLTVAELGIGGAITFCMYSPIVNGDKAKVAALYQLFKKVYLIIAGIILVAGLAVLPALPYLAKGYSQINVNLYLTFALMLASVVLTYFFGAKTSLINAYKDNYITTTITSVGQLFRYCLQIVILVLTQSFVGYLVCRIISVLIQWGLTEIFARKSHRDIIKYAKQPLDAVTKNQVIKNGKAMFMHRIGGILVNTADSMIISAFIGVVLLGKYSNYTTVMTAMVGVIMLFFSPLTSVIGHMFVEQGVEQAKKYFNFFYALNFALGIIFFLGYYATIDNLVTLLFGAGLELPGSVSIVITVNYFIQFLRQSTSLFRDATGTFYNDRWKPLIEGTLNVALSIAFVLLFEKFWGENFAVVGVIVATIITNLAICHIVEPYVLYKHAFKTTVKPHLLKNYLCILVFAVAIAGLHFAMRSFDSQVVELLVNGCISIGISAVVVTGVLLLDKDFRHYFKAVLNKIRAKFKRTKATVTAETDEKVENHDATDEKSATQEVSDKKTKQITP